MGISPLLSVLSQRIDTQEQEKDSTPKDTNEIEMQRLEQYRLSLLLAQCDASKNLGKTVLGIRR